jgi:hypothetical protein
MDSRESADALAAEVLPEFFCAHCGYNLRGLPDGRCPECGETFERTALATSQIPWLHRREIGRLRAWWRTTWLALFRPSRFAASINAPCPYADARRFWLVSLIPPAAGMAWLGVAAPLRFQVRNIGMASSVEAWLLPWYAAMYLALVRALAAVLTLIVATGAMSYLFQLLPRPQRQQDRAAAMSLYISGALSACILLQCAVALLACLLAVLTDGSFETIEILLTNEALLLLLAVPPLAWWLATCQLNSLLAGGSLARRAFAASASLLIVVIAAAIVGGVLPWCLGLLRLMLSTGG